MECKGEKATGKRLDDAAPLLYWYTIPYNIIPEPSSLNPKP